MSKVEAPSFVKAWLDSFAEKISGFHERMMVQNEELLLRSEEANLQTQQILIQYRPSPDLNQALSQDVPEPPQIKEEPEWSIKQEEEEPPV